MFRPEAVTQVRQIQRLMAMGFSLEEIRSFPDCMRLVEGDRACPSISAVYRRRLKRLEQQIEELERRRQRLRRLLMDGDGGSGAG